MADPRTGRVPASPMTRDLPTALRLPLRGAGALLALAMLSFAAFSLLGVGRPGLADLFNNWVVTGVSVAAAASAGLRAAAVPAERRAWGVLAAGLASYALGTAYWSFHVNRLDPPPYPSVCDALWTLLYPAGYVAIVMLVRRSMRRFHRSVWLDGLIAALGVSAVSAAFVYDAIVASSQGAAPLAVATNLAYPLWDLVLLATVMAVAAMSGGRGGRALMLLGAGFVAFTAADALYVNQVADNSYVPGGLPNLLWTGALALVAVAPWQRSEPGRLHLDGWRMLAVPALFTAAALGLLLYDHFARLNLLALVLAAATLVCAMARTAFTFREVRSLADSRRQALTDELTGLPNRRSCMQRLSAAITRAQADGSDAALLMIDLDRFKELNDTLGHTAGDELLGQLGPRLQQALGSAGTVARLGGDEFAVLLAPGSGAAAGIAAARRLSEAIERPFSLRGLEVHVGASIGVAVFPEHAGSADELLQRADVAMYQAKGAGLATSVYAAQQDEHSRDRLLLATQLRRAVARDELTLLYQPKACARTGDVLGVEALVRWQHPDHGLMSPVQFLGLAEQTGLMRALTIRVLELALAQARRWREQGAQLTMAVNLSTASVLDEQLPGDVAGLLARHGVPPRMLKLEVTENTVLGDPERAMSVLERLVQLGVGISLDDFGTGYSSLTHLRLLPVDELKLDRSFVMGMAFAAGDAAIVESTVALAHRLGLNVVAEGVEDERTWHMLAALGCDEIQGYRLSPPVTGDELRTWLAGRDAGAPALRRSA